MNKRSVFGVCLVISILWLVVFNVLFRGNNKNFSTTFLLPTYRYGYVGQNYTDDSTTLHGNLVNKTNDTSRDLLEVNESSAPKSSSNSKKKKSCWRVCPPRQHTKRSMIVYHNWIPAGLNDRLAIISDLVSLAGWLCGAIVIFPPPHYMLADKHSHKPPPPIQLQQQPSSLDNNKSRSSGMNIIYPSSTTSTTSSLKVVSSSSLSKDLQWSDFINITFLKDGTSSLRTMNMSDGIIPRLYGDSGGDDVDTTTAATAKVVSPSKLRFYRGGQYKDWTHIVTKDQRTFRQDLEQLNNHVRKYRQQEQFKDGEIIVNNNNNGTDSGINDQANFVWTIRMGWFHAGSTLKEWMQEQRQKLLLLSSSSDSLELQQLPALVGDTTTDGGCNYVHSRIPDYQYQIADQIIKHVKEYTFSISEASASATRPLNSTNDKILIGFFHIRRGDEQARQECDTSLERIQSYVNCSFSKLHEKVSHMRSSSQRTSSVQERRVIHIKILFASDEQDPTYRSSVRNIILEQQQQQQQQVLKQRGTLSPIVTIEFFDLDALLWQIVYQNIEQKQLPARLANNFFIYQVGTILQWTHSDFVLLQRRTISCNECDNWWVDNVL